MSKLDTAVWLQGYLAGMAGMQAGVPYAPGDARNWVWTSGYIEGTAASTCRSRFRSVRHDGAHG
ncbi:MAG: hypothetical protein EPN21_04270 [Methylococcaceae bacterium]|nr:MAG: hypothetical protein EPN21_04270 [Methylococcaceae bacterium]